MWLSALDNTDHASQTLSLVFLLQQKAKQNKTRAFSVYLVNQQVNVSKSSISEFDEKFWLQSFRFIFLNFSLHLEEYAYTNFMQMLSFFQERFWELYLWETVIKLTMLNFSSVIKNIKVLVRKKDCFSNPSFESLKILTPTLSWYYADN